MERNASCVDLCVFVCFNFWRKIARIKILFLKRRMSKRANEQLIRLCRLSVYVCLKKKSFGFLIIEKLLFCFSFSWGFLKKKRSHCPPLSHMQRKTEKSLIFFVVFNGVCVDVDGKCRWAWNIEEWKKRKIRTERNFSFFGRVHKHSLPFVSISFIFIFEGILMFILQYFHFPSLTPFGTQVAHILIHRNQILIVHTWREK